MPGSPAARSIGCRSMATNLILRESSTVERDLLLLDLCKSLCRQTSIPRQLVSMHQVLKSDSQASMAGTRAALMAVDLHS